MIDFWTGAGIFALGIFAYVIAGKMLKVPIGIGPGDYPRVIAIGLCILGGILSLQSVLKGFPKAQGKVPWKSILRVFALVLMSFIYIQSMRYLGFLITTPVFLAAAIYHFGNRNWKSTIAVSVGVTLVVYFVFVSLFQVLLPRFSLF